LKLYSKFDIDSTLFSVESDPIDTLVALNKFESSICLPLTIILIQNMIQSLPNDLYTLLHDCLRGSHSPYYLKYFQVEGKALLLNTLNGKFYEPGSIRSYCGSINNIFISYGIKTVIPIMEVLEIISQTNKIDPKSKNKSRVKCARDCIIKIYNHLKNKFQLKQSDGLETPKDNNAPTNIIYKQKITIKKKDIFIHQLKTNETQVIQALQVHNNEIKLPNHIPKVIPYEEECTYPLKLNQVTLIDSNKNLLKEVHKHIQTNTYAHAEKDNHISQMQTQLTTTTNENVTLKKDIIEFKKEIIEFKKELKLTQNLFQTKNKENLQLINENIVLKNKKPLDDFLTPQQILDTTPQSQPCDIGHIFCGRQKPDLDRGDPYYKIGLTIKTKPIIQVVHTLGLNAELLEVIRIKCIHSATTNLVNIFKIKFGTPIDNMDTFKADPLLIRRIIAAYIDHHQLKL
jgi:hypothetical protein